MNFEIPVDEELRYLANAMTADARAAMFLANKALTDEQRKAIFAKYGSGGGGGRQVYTRANPNGGGSGGGSTPPLTVSSVGPDLTQNSTGGLGVNGTHAQGRDSDWVLSLSPEKMAEEYANDPQRLKSAIQDAIDNGAYAGVQVNGHAPSVMDVINNNIAPDYVPMGKTLTDEEVARRNGAGAAAAVAVALDPSTGKPLQEGQDSWSHLGGNTGTSTSGGSSDGASSSSDTGSSSDAVSSSSGGGSSVASLDDAISNLPVDDAGDGSSGGGSSANTALTDFFAALANAHF